MQYVSKQAVLDAIENWIKCDDFPAFTAEDAWNSACRSIKNDIEDLQPVIDTDLDIAEIFFREKREPIKVREGLTICPTCRKQLKDGHSYCKKCGQAILRGKGGCI